MTIRVDIEPIDGVRSRVLRHGIVIASGAGAVVCQAARLLLATGNHARHERLEAYRGSMLCLFGPLSAFARLTVRENPRQGPDFIRYVPFDPERLAR